MERKVWRSWSTTLIRLIPVRIDLADYLISEIVGDRHSYYYLFGPCFPKLSSNLVVVHVQRLVDSQLFLQRFRTKAL